MQKAKELVAAVRQRKARRAQEKLLREPSRLWREGRLARSQSAAKEEAERRFLAEQRFEVEQKIRHARDLERYKRAKEAEAARRKQEEEEDKDRLDNFHQEKRRILALEKLGFVQEALRQKAAEEAEARRLAEENKRKALEEERKAKEAADTKRHAEALRKEREETLQEIMRKAGMVAAKPKQKKKKELPPGIDKVLVVRFHEDVDADIDAETMEFNLKPLVDYIRAFPGKTDHARHFAQFFGHSIRVMKGKCLGEEGGLCLGLALSVGACSNARTLDFSWNDLRFKGVNALCAQFEKVHILEQLQVVILRGNNIDDVCLRRLAEAVERLGGACKVKELDVSCNSIRDAGVKRFAHAIFNNAPLLKKVNFHSNRIGDIGAKCLLSLAHTRADRMELTALECIRLQNNSISPQCARELSNTSNFSPFLML